MHQYGAEKTPKGGERGIDPASIQNTVAKKEVVRGMLVAGPTLLHQIKTKRGKKEDWFLAQV